VKEQFPFSHFPMYESFSDYSFIVYIADKNGDPIPVQTITRFKISEIKKIFNAEQKAERKRLEKEGVKIDGYQFMTKEQRHSAGVATLESLYKNCKPEGMQTLREMAPLQLYYVHLRMGEDGFEEKEEFIAELPAPSE